LLLIAMTGWGQEKDKEDAARAGFDIHLTKPVDLNSLEELFMAGRPVNKVPSNINGLSV
jgi:CheY-like chemotaxis protein